MNAYSIRRYQANAFGANGYDFTIVAIVQADHPVAALQLFIGHNWKIRHVPPIRNTGDDPVKDQNRYIAHFDNHFDTFRVTLTDQS